MLKHIQIENFALIDSLNLELESGLTMITGETGAGKSILLGALGLILGNRADLSAIRDTSRKCIVDAQFDISKLDLQETFEEYDLDYDHTSFLRREILPSGKSRAFINDTPVNLQVMNRIGERLIDIHSQHQTLQLAKDTFQIEVLNSFVIEATKNVKKSFAFFLQKYQEELSIFKAAQKELKALELKGIEFSKELDYNNFLLNELEEANLDQLNQNALEDENEQLSNVEGITEVLTEFDATVSTDDQGILDQLRHLQSKFQSISSYSKKYENLKDRVSSILLELEDIHQEVVHEIDAIEPDPERLTQINELLSLLENLYRKHQVEEVENLIQIRDELADKVFESQGLDKKIKKQESIIANSKNNLQKLGKELTALRRAHKEKLEQEVIAIVQQLGMPDAQFKVDINSVTTFGAYGVDEIKFVFTANKGSQLLALDKAASGGELSRLMLAIKSILSRCENLPTIIFDEIDTGVSGAIATQMAQIMKKMSRGLQVMAITHLPQIASAGNDHLIVKKTSNNNTTYSSIERLDPAARLEEIAQMLSGGEISNAARENARALLN